MANLDVPGDFLGSFGYIDTKSDILCFEYLAAKANSECTNCVFPVDDL